MITTEAVAIDVLNYLSNSDHSPPETKAWCRRAHDAWEAGFSSPEALDAYHEWLTLPAPENDQAPQPASEKKRKPKLSVIAADRFAARHRLFRTPDGDAYAVIDSAAVPLGDKRVADELRSLAWEDRLVLSNHHVDEARGNLTMRARDGEQHDVHLRVVETDGKIWIDLGAGGAGFVEVTAEGWKLHQRCPVMFRRPSAQRPLPTPVRGASLRDLRPFVNVASDDDFALLLAFILGTYRPSCPCAIACITGEQGSAKSTATRVIRALTDPNAAPLRTPRKSEDDLVVTAKHSHVITLENVSYLGPELLDALCRLCTGGGLAKRTLYSDDDETVIDVRRAIVVNGIDDFTERGDFAERSVILQLKRVETRITEKAFWQDFEAAAPRIFGAILDALVVALRRLPDVRVDNPPRMADFAEWFAAASPALGLTDAEAVELFRKNQAAATAKLESDPLVMLLDAAIRQHGKPEGDARVICLRPEAVHALLAGLNVASRTPVAKFPAAPNSLGCVLRRRAPQLRQLGFIVDLDGAMGRGAGKARCWTLGYELESAAGDDGDDRGR